ncbi:MAG: ATP-binding cassette domain-containing protein [Dehalococcoidia bacterium]|nr:ATP-binding cassette domain-containing protein [Dehalococcoidia bacterium]
MASCIIPHLCATCKTNGPLLQVQGLTKDYNGFRAIEDISFEASGGEIFGLLGPNGAGKTTTIRLISAILSPTRGTARICGYDVRETPEAVRRNIGMLTTEMGVYDRLSGREYLRYFGALYSMAHDRTEARIRELSQLLEMEDFLDRRTSSYSTGMKQKLSIARSVLHDPSIVILDEPTSGLDVLAAQTVLNFMRRSRDQGRLVVLSTHHMPDAEKLCNRAAILHHGRLLAVRTISELKSDTGTGNLEDAFLAMVKERPQEAKPANRKATISARRLPVSRRLLIRIGIAVAVIIALQLWRMLTK